MELFWKKKEQPEQFSSPPPKTSTRDRGVLLPVLRSLPTLSPRNRITSHQWPETGEAAVTSRPRNHHLQTNHRPRGSTHGEVEDTDFAHAGQGSHMQEIILSWLFHPWWHSIGTPNNIVVLIFFLSASISHLPCSKRNTIQKLPNTVSRHEFIYKSKLIWSALQNYR